VFVPARFGSGIGLYVPFIYPSAWEPILLGREIYGFPKRLGKTALALNRRDAETHKGRGEPPVHPYMRIDG
jgi:acetoacetate decarboxylase